MNPRPIFSFVNIERECHINVMPLGQSNFEKM